MSKENVLICDRCDQVVRGVDKPKDAVSDLVVHTRGDLSLIKSSMGITDDPKDPGPANKPAANALEDLCDECRDEVAELVGQIFRTAT